MSHIFISHATADDAFVTALRQQLEAHNLQTWVDSRNLRGGDALDAVITEAIQSARAMLVVISPQTINSIWVRTEISLGLSTEAQLNAQVNPLSVELVEAECPLRQAQGTELTPKSQGAEQLHAQGKQNDKASDYRVIPILLPGVEPAALGLWFEREPLAVPIETHVSGLTEAMPALLAALGERAPEDPEPAQLVERPTADRLTLEIHQPQMMTTDAGAQRAIGLAQLIYQSHDEAIQPIKSSLIPFTAPIGIIEMDDLDWYLEEYFRWPMGVGSIDERKNRIENSLPAWGKAIFDAVFGTEAARNALNAWQRGDAAQLLFSVEVATVEQAPLPVLAHEAASTLLALPWELLHDGKGYLFQGKRPLRVRRQIPNQEIIQRQPVDPPIRILLVSPRPELQADGTGSVSYIDHRASALPLVTAVAALDEMAAVTMLAEPTLSALNRELERARDAGIAYDVVHFDGHGVYDKRVGLGALCFEDERDVDVIGKRRVKLVHANTLAERMRDYNVPLIFLDACQTAQSEDQPTASVAARLLQGGTTSVVAMSHSVLVETATRFVTAFYRNTSE
ncbi:MAG: TIR domain-containing protein [Chloroflexota bacterium]